LIEPVNEFLRQGMEDSCPLEQTLERLGQLTAGWEFTAADVPGQQTSHAASR
jgi:hypothetical protein